MKGTRICNSTRNKRHIICDADSWEDLLQKGKQKLGLHGDATVRIVLEKDGFEVDTDGYFNCSDGALMFLLPEESWNLSTSLTDDTQTAQETTGVTTSKRKLKLVMKEILKGKENDKKYILVNWTLDHCWEVLIVCTALFIYLQMSRGSLDVESLIGLGIAAGIAWFILLEDKEEKQMDHASVQTEENVECRLSGLLMDETLKPMSTGATVVDAVVDKIQHSGIFSNDKMFLRRIALAESNDGTNYDCSSGGIWQVDEKSFKATQDVHQNPGLREILQKILHVFSLDWLGVGWQDLKIPFYSGMAARLKLHTIAKEIPWNTEEQATLWKQKFTSNPKASKATFNQVSGNLNVGTDIGSADIIFVLDGSGSIGQDNFDEMRQFVIKVCQAFSISEQGVRVGVIVYSNQAEVVFPLGEQCTQQRLVSAVKAMRYPGGGTNTSDGLECLRKMMRDQGRALTSGQPRIAIVITDGRSCLDETKKSASKVHKENITVFAVGVTDNINQEELEVIASKKDGHHVFNLDSFSDVQHFINEAQKRFSKVSVKIPVGSTITGELKSGQGQNYMFMLKSAGVYVKLSAITGSVSLYLSYDSPNPSDAYNNYKLHADRARSKQVQVNVPAVVQGRNTYQHVYAVVYGDGAAVNKFQIEIL